MKPVHPVIEHFGKVWPRPGAAVQPATDAVYRVLVGAVKFPDENQHPLPGFSHAANIVNVFAAAGVDVRHNLKLAVVIYGPSVFGCVSNERYAAKTGKENPNVLLVSELKRAGVELLICGQMLHHMDIREEDLLEEITVTLSGAVTLAEYQRRGYTLVPSSTDVGG